jgi:hypothetical protein
MVRGVSLTPGKRVLFLTKDFELIKRQLRGSWTSRCASCAPPTCWTT